MGEYFIKPKPHKRSDWNVKVEFELSNDASKADLKEKTCVDTLDLEAKLDLTGLKAEVHKIHMNKLRTIAADLNKISCF